VHNLTLDHPKARREGTADPVPTPSLINRT